MWPYAALQVLQRAWQSLNCEICETMKWIILFVEVTEQNRPVQNYLGLLFSFVCAGHGGFRGQPRRYSSWCNAGSSPYVSKGMSFLFLLDFYRGELDVQLFQFLL